MKYYKNLFSKKGLIKNIGSYILLSIIFIYIITLILFVLKGFGIIYDTISQIVKDKLIKNDNKNENENKNENKNKKEIKNIYKKEKRKSIENSKINKDDKKMKRKSIKKKGNNENKNKSRNSIKKKGKLKSTNINNPSKKKKSSKNNIMSISENDYISYKTNTKLELKLSDKRIISYKRQSAKEPFPKQQKIEKKMLNYHHLHYIIILTLLNYIFFPIFY